MQITKDLAKWPDDMEISMNMSSVLHQSPQEKLTFWTVEEGGKEWMKNVELLGFYRLEPYSYPAENMYYSSNKREKRKKERTSDEKMVGVGKQSGNLLPHTH